MIKDLRVRAGVSQQGLADELSVTRQTVSSWENDKSEPNLDTLFALGKYFDVPIFDLIAQASQTRQELKHEPQSTALIKRVGRFIPSKAGRPFLILFSIIIGLIIELPLRTKVPLLFFFSLASIFFLTCLFLYFLAMYIFRA